MSRRMALDGKGMEFVEEESDTIMSRMKFWMLLVLVVPQAAEARDVRAGVGRVEITPTQPI